MWFRLAYTALEPGSAAGQPSCIHRAFHCAHSLAEGGAGLVHWWRASLCIRRALHALQGWWWAGGLVLVLGWSPCRASISAHRGERLLCLWPTRAFVGSADAARPCSTDFCSATNPTCIAQWCMPLVGSVGGSGVASWMRGSAPASVCRRKCCVMVHGHCRVEVLKRASSALCILTRALVKRHVALRTRVFSGR